MSVNNQLICIVGPTAVGKTSMSIQLAKHFDTVVVSADSRQIYQEMSIGTAKPSKEEQDNITHYFIDSHSIHQNYSVGDYEREAIPLLDELFTKHSKVILVGGSGLFVKAILDGLDNLPPISTTTRNYTDDLFQKHGLEFIQNLLKEKDFQSYTSIEIQNPRRVIRALEVFFETGNTYSSILSHTKANRNFNSKIIGLNLPREELYSRINLRVDLMIQEGLLNEVANLLPYKNLTSLNTVGYKEIFSFLNKEITIEEAIDKIKQNSRIYAKKQITWFNKQDGIQWFSPNQKEEILKYILN